MSPHKPDRAVLLFTGGGGAGTEALYSQYSTAYEVHFADADQAAIPPIVPTGHRHSLPYANAPDFVDGLAALCRMLGVGLLIPSVDEELLHMAAIAAAVPNLDILVPAPDYVATMLDKKTAMEALRKAGIDAPKSALIGQIETIGFPCFVKPRSGRGSRGIATLHTPLQAQAYLALSDFDAADILVQELLQGQEYTVLMAADKTGHLHAVVPCRVDIKRGITLRAETEQNHAVIEACQKIHQALPTSGCYNIQLMLTAAGRVAPFEINPRISTTYCLSVAAGVDPIALFHADPSNKVLAPFINGCKLRRYWNNQFSQTGDQ